MDLLNCYSIKINPHFQVPLPLGFDGFFKLNTFLMEKWKDIDGYNGMYQVSNKGKVRSWKNNKWGKLKSPKILSAFKVNGYFRVALSKNNNATQYSIHRLVCEAFIPNPENKREVNHIDAVKTNNEISNLEWVTSSENKNHAIMMGLHGGEINGMSKLCENDVIEIREKYTPRVYTRVMLSKEYGVSVSCIDRVIQKESWKHVNE